MLKRNIILLISFICILPVYSLRPLVWVIDAGHGGKDTGTEGTKIPEKDINLAVAHELVTLLKKNKPGIKIILTRDKDVFLSLDERCQIANNANADLFLSIHVNSVIGKPLLRGTETYYASSEGMSDAVLLSAHSRNRDKSELLAWLMQKCFHDQGRETNRGIKPERLYVLTHTMMPAVLTEIGFISNIEEESYMNSKRGQKEIAQAIFNALMEYYTTTQDKTNKKTLKRLRNTNGVYSGLKPLKQEESSAIPQVQEQTVVKTNQNEDNDSITVNEIADSTNISKEKIIDDTEKKQEEVKQDVPTPIIPIFSIQLFATSKELKATDEQLKGLTPVTYFKSGNMFKCLYGGTTDYKQAKKTLQDIRTKFPDAFIVATLGEEFITTAEALDMIKP